MKTKTIACALGLSLLASTALAATQGPAPTPAPRAPQSSTPTNTGKRINRAIEVLKSGQPVYYLQVSGGGYDDGKKAAATKADYILYDMEHGAFDIMELRGFMRGLVDAGPTRTGHRTPAVVVTLPATGPDPISIKANGWMIQQVLAAGIHGILLCQAESPEAVKAFIEATRYPFAPVVQGLDTGTRGSGSQSFAAQIWGIPQNEYLRVADTWPANPDGEIMLGIKIENPKAVTRAEESTRVPGLTFAEWGPGDQGFYLLGRPGAPSTPTPGGEANPLMAATRARVLAATKSAKIFFLNACSENNVIQQIQDGTMICTGGDSPAADKGRAFTKRTAPW
jgi:4-hydroxy-2-oxoheptanedioate aldolase